MLLCNTFPGTMSEKGGMVGGVNCKSGMIYGKFVLLQNAYLSADLSLAEVVVYGTREGREGKAADMSSVQAFGRHCVLRFLFLFLTEEAYSHGTTPDKEVWPSPFKCQPAPI